MKKFPTELIWSIFHDKPIATLREKEGWPEKIVRLLKKLFPGMRLTADDMPDFFEKIFVPAIKKQFSEMAKLPLEKATEIFGEWIEPLPVQRCKGFEWKNWPEMDVIVTTE
ncbi:MAG: hypothetical protein JWO73_559 [Candidatus Taylorbacteria bacterium]|nr:hypothetical protein [Candidatus Taylorbacteria bacterium]